MKHALLAALEASACRSRAARPQARHPGANPVAVSPDTVLAEALRIMNDNAILVLFVVDGGKLVGIVHMHDIVRAGLV
jgi:CBS domain-containing protein